MNNVIQMPVKQYCTVAPLAPINPNRRKVVYVRRVSVQQIKRLMELGYTVILR
jgi:hypothetical protein